MSEYSTKARPYIFDVWYESTHPVVHNYHGTFRVLAYDMKEAEEQFKRRRWELELDAPPSLHPLGKECKYSVKPEILDNEKNLEDDDE